MALPILPRQHWRSRLLYSASNFVRAYRARRGFYRITTAIRRGSRRYLGGSYMPVAYRGGVLWINPGNDMDSGIFARGVYEPGTIGLIEELSRAGYSYVDVGGNIGSHVTAAVLAAAPAQSGQTFTVFEPSPFTLSVLRWNLRANGIESRVTLWECAASDEPGELIFYAAAKQNPGNDGISRRDPSQVEIRVPAVRVDDVMPLPVSGRTLFKIDAEGSEPRVLAGAARMLETTPGIIVLFEHHARMLEAGGADRGSVTSLLERLGFRFYELIESTGRLVAFDPAAKDFCNCLAVRAMPELLAPRLA